MHPLLFEVGGHEVMAYTAMHWLGIAAALVVAAVLAPHRGLPARTTVAVLAVAGLGSFFGARLFSALLNPGIAAADPGVFLGLRMGVFHLEGAIVVGVALAVPAARKAGIALGPLVDVAAVAMATRIAFLRVGCFLAGCCFGVETDQPWGVTFPVGSHAWTDHVLEGSDAGVVGLLSAGGPHPPVHPTQLYEAVAAAVVAGLALWLWPRVRTAGVPGLAAAAVFLTFRAISWTLRAPSYEAPTWVLSTLSLTVAATCVVTLVRHQRLTAPDREPVPGR